MTVLETARAFCDNVSLVTHRGLLCTLKRPKYCTTYTKAWRRQQLLGSGKSSNQCLWSCVRHWPHYPCRISMMVDIALPTVYNISPGPLILLAYTEHVDQPVCSKHLGHYSPLQKIVCASLLSWVFFRTSSLMQI